MWPNIEKLKVWDSEMCRTKVWDAPVVLGAGKEISNTLAADGQDIQKPEIEEKHLIDFKAGHFISEKLWNEFLGRWGKNDELEKVKVKEFEEKFEDFKEINFGRRGIIY